MQRAAVSHRPHLLRLAGVLAVAVLSTHIARAAEPKAPRSNAPSPNLRFGFPVVGLITSTTLRVKGREDFNEGMGDYIGGSLAYAHPLLPYLTLMGLARWTTEETDWSDERREVRSRFDIALAPELGWSPRSKPPVRATFRVSIPLGPTWSWIKLHQAGPVRHEYSTGFGLNVGLVAGVDVVWSHSGFFMEFAALRHLTTVDHTATLVADPSVTSSEKYHFDQASVGLGAGYIYRF